ncbi:uncharacterized protein METZ01_LOCUS66246 [marine metagenome]|uniref:Carrier domain-containing protein n=1 Tax=marine metagenome TaxID=408172 RepID=A0A381TB80_9ZZZZ
MIKQYKTLIDLFEDQKQSQGIIRFISGEKDEYTLTFEQFWQETLLFLGALQSKGVKPNDELIILTTSNKRFLLSFWASILGGIIPVPVAPGISDEHKSKLFYVAEHLNHPSLVTDNDTLERLTKFVKNRNISDSKSLLTSHCITADNSQLKGKVLQRNPNDIAFIQYSSGSTTVPKGIVLSHKNLTSNIYSIAKKLNFTKHDSVLSWMPLTHDMGLIGNHISLLGAGLSHSIMDTNLFIRRPLLWLKKASEYKATILSSPNFGYKHYLKQFEKSQNILLDLSCVRLVINGAEPISSSICNQFINALRPYGLNQDTMFPVYGLAEATLGVTFPALNKKYSTISLKRYSVSAGEAVIPSQPNGDTITFVKVGEALGNCEFRLTDLNDKAVPENVIGHIQIRGDNVTSKIYNDPKTSKEMFTSDQWLKTGDYGFKIGNELVITGRLKEIIIINGQNYYPHDIEEIITQGKKLELGMVAACRASDPVDQTDQLIIFFLHRKDLSSATNTINHIRSVIGKILGIEIKYVIPNKTIPKTTSGKIQRLKLAQEYSEGKFDQIIDDLKNATKNFNKKSDSFETNTVLDDLISITSKYSEGIEINADDNLFEVGISSLTLTEIMLEIEEEYPRMISIDDLFENPTLRQLSNYLNSQK